MEVAQPGWTSRNQKWGLAFADSHCAIRGPGARMGEGHQSGESARMALDIHAVKGIEELKSEIAIESAAKEKSSVVEKPPIAQILSAPEKSSPAEETTHGDGSIGISLIDLA